jgi:uncharacterized membrane protein
MSVRTFVISTTRLENFSDGVFTIVLTLLAFQFKVPKFSDDATLHQNLMEFSKILPNVIGFVFSFIFVAVFWVNHHHLYHTIKEVDSTLLWYNIHSLFWITTMPFTISMVGDHPQIKLVAFTLGFILFMSSLSAYLLRRYSYVRSRLADETLSFESIRDGLNKNMAAIIISVTGTVAAVFSVYASYLIYLVVLVIFMIPQKLEKRKRSTINQEIL